MADALYAANSTGSMSELHSKAVERPVRVDQSKSCLSFHRFLEIKLGMPKAALQNFRLAVACMYAVLG
jgi:hypothetical protein